MPHLQSAPFDCATFLKQVPLFANLDEERLRALANDFHLFTYPRGNIIFHQGEIGRTLFVVVSGKVRIYSTTPEGGETTTNIFARGDIFGEFSIFDGLPRSSTAKTLTKCELLQITDEAWLRHFRASPELAQATARMLTLKIRWTATIAEALAQGDAVNRLIRMLLLYVEQFGEAQGDGSYVLDWGLSQSDLATLLGVRREWLNQILSKWQKRELLILEEGKVTIPNLPRLLAERDALARRQWSNRTVGQ
ncbi:MAG: Crp/Fnr family transcriptional regulator [Anaerolineae bacterium]|nr:Crp/Fnr family transcriptional regulator [Anaerolineae bacterium]